MTFLSDENSLIVEHDEGFERDVDYVHAGRAALRIAAEGLTPDSMPMRGLPATVKRAIDIFASAVLLVLFAPLMAVIALAVRLSSPGPAIFRQTRVGRGGRPFTILKFRTMTHASAEPSGEALTLDCHKPRNDARVTRLGRLLRTSSLDELPQLINVLRGEMSLVGPRPEVLWLFEAHYQSWQRARVLVTPGITGWWQVNGRSNRPLHASTEDDIFYIVNWSLWLDVLILFRTFGAVFRGRGAF